MKVEECFERRLLRKIKADNEKATRSLEMAYKKLKLAKTSFEKELYDICIVYSYMAMFHSARALLYKDGVQEKSHACLVIYLKEKYADKIPYYLLQSLDVLRKERHEALYGLEYASTKDDAEMAIKDAEEFLEIVEGML